MLEVLYSTGLGLRIAQPALTDIDTRMATFDASEKVTRNAWFHRRKAIAAVEAYLAGARPKLFRSTVSPRTIMLCSWAERPAAQAASASGKSCTIMAPSLVCADA